MVYVEPDRGGLRRRLAGPLASGEGVRTRDGRGADQGREGRGDAQSTSLRGPARPVVCRPAHDHRLSEDVAAGRRTALVRDLRCDPPRRAGVQGARRVPRRGSVRGDVRPDPVTVELRRGGGPPRARVVVRHVAGAARGVTASGAEGGAHQTPVGWSGKYGMSPRRATSYGF
ncbi:hypothetical protein CP980_00895 [Streptomyces vinaceus]|uniref:Uncharacterized protein n=1 Tax=Streptomyces vinaceus TaxID=1960 RepID=A0A5J6J0V4_STRVI|nr:hypothetical protein CP980_00895 [Streptomyces vinaceus]